MKIQDVMVSDVETIDGEETVQTAAQLMLERDVGFLAVSRGDRLVGVITDRDIVLRVVAAALLPEETLVEEAMTEGTKYCYEDEDAEHVVRNMTEIAVMRLPVMSRDQRLVGVVSMDDLIPLRPPSMGLHTH